MVSVFSKLYPVCNDVMVKDLRTADCITFTNADETQPLMPEPVFIDPDKLIL